jgi:hypothetical protein
MYQRFRDVVHPPGVVVPVESVVATTDVLADAERVEEGLHRDHATLLDARNYFEQQATNWEANYRELTGAAAVDSPQPHGNGRDRAASNGSRLASLALRMYNSDSLLLHTAAAYGCFVKKERRLSPRWRRAGMTTVPIRINTSIPRLSWAARRRSGTWDFTVGAAVESRAHGFFEGVWDADFDAFRPDLAAHRFGSGMVMTEDGPTFLCAFAGEPLYAVVQEATGDVIVSNSPIFALTASGILPGDPAFDSLTEDIRDRAMVLCDLGVERAPTLLSEDRTRAMHLISYFNFRVTDTGRVSREWIVPRREFRTFEQYRSLLSDTLGRAVRNGES